MPRRRTRTLLASALAAVAAVAALVPAQAAPPDVRDHEIAQRLIARLGDGPLVVTRDSTDAPEPVSGLGPGSQLVIDRPDGEFLCTAAFVFHGGGAMLLGAAGHCFLPSNAVATHGPGADYDASRSTVYACINSCVFGGQSGAVFNRLVRLGPVRYARQTQDGVDIGQDFGLVQIPAGMSWRAGVPVWHGPRSAAPALGAGQPVCLFGQGTGVAETFTTMARAGVGVFSNATTWGAEMPSVVGDSGSAVVSCNAGPGGLEGDAAVGVLTHTVVGTAVIEGTTLAQAQRMARQAGFSIGLVTG